MRKSMIPVTETIADLLMPYQPAGNWPMYEIYGEVIQGMLNEEARKVAAARAAYPHIEVWRNKLPIEHHTCIGRFFRYVREFGQLIMTEAPKIKEEGEFGWVYTSPLHRELKRRLTESDFFSTEESKKDLRRWLWLLDHRISLYEQDHEHDVTME